MTEPCLKMCCLIFLLCLLTLLRYLVPKEFLHVLATAGWYRPTTADQKSSLPKKSGTLEISAGMRNTQDTMRTGRGKYRGDQIRGTRETEIGRRNLRDVFRIMRIGSSKYRDSEKLGTREEGVRRGNLRDALAVGRQQKLRKCKGDPLPPVERTHVPHLITQCWEYPPHLDSTLYLPNQRLCLAGRGPGMEGG